MNIGSISESTIKISELDSAVSVNDADIIPIVQNGDTKKVTVENLLDNVYDTINELYNGTGWIEIKQSDLAQGTVGSGYYVPAYKKIGNIVYLKGQITGITTRASEIFTLPNGFYKSDSRLSFCTTNDNTEINFIRINNAGTLMLQRSTGDFTNGINIYLDGITYTTN